MDAAAGACQLRRQSRGCAPPGVDAARAGASAAADRGPGAGRRARRRPRTHRRLRYRHCLARDQLRHTEVRLGLTPSTIAPYVIAAIGERAARRYFLTGERFDTDEALRIGLIHEIADAAA